MEKSEPQSRRVLDYARRPVRPDEKLVFQSGVDRVSIEIPPISRWQWLVFRLVGLSVLCLLMVVFIADGNPILFIVMGVFIFIMSARLIHLIFHGRTPARIEVDSEVLHVQTTTPAHHLNQFIPSKVVADVSFTHLGRKISGFETVMLNVEQLDGTIHSFPIRVPERVGIGRFLDNMEREVRRVIGLPPRPRS